MDNTKCTGCNGSGEVREAVGTLQNSRARIVKCRACDGSGVYSA